MEGNTTHLDPRLGGVGSVANAFDWSTSNATPREHEDELGYNPQINNSGYDQQLRDARRASKNTLRKRFEHIFDKYGRDFEGIGDEIDLTTGDIVVDNGHIKNMQHEIDVGSWGPAESQPGEEEDKQIHNHTSDALDESDSQYDADSDDEGSSFEEPGVGAFSNRDSTDDSVTSLFEPDESAQDDEPAVALAKRAGPADFDTTSRSNNGYQRNIGPASGAADMDTGDGNTRVIPDAIFGQMPGLQESMLSLQSMYRQGQRIDPDTIQALGMSIANQLASFVAGGPQRQPQESRQASGSRREHSELPAERPAKRLRRSLSPSAGLSDPSPNKKSIWAPGGHPRPQMRKRRRQTAEAQNNTLSATEDDVTDSQAVDNENTVRICTHCQSTSSHIWRKGPTGRLCNTCGMYLYRYGLLRPLNPSLDNDTQGSEETDGEMDPLLRDWLEWQESGDKIVDARPIGVQNTRFALEEDALLIRLKEIESLSWERAAMHFPGRSAYALQCRYSKKLLRQAPEARELLISQGYQGKPDAQGVIEFSYTRIPFAEHEDELLLKLRDEDGLDWAQIAKLLNGRSLEVLEQRYRELGYHIISGRPSTPVSRKKAAVDGPDPFPKNVPYTEEEDALIVQLREIDNLKWGDIAEQMGGRNSFSLQKRYIRELCGRHPDSICPARKAYNHFAETMKYGRQQSVPPETSRPRSEDLDENSLLQSDFIRDGFRILNMKEQPSPQELAVPSASPAASSGNKILNGQADEHAMGVVNEDESTQTDAMGAQSFTLHEDELIVKLRELESRSWPDIADQMPSHKLSSISNRYYRHLLPQKARAIEAAVQNFKGISPVDHWTSASSANKASKASQNKKWTTCETDMLVMLRGQGKSWKEIAERLPGRSARGSETHYYMLFGRPKKSSLGSGAAGHEDQVPLLKQAVNNLRRRSASNATAPAGPSQTETTVDSSRGSRRPYRLLLPSPFPRPQAEATVPPVNIPPSIQRQAISRIVAPAPAPAPIQSEFEFRSPNITTPPPLAPRAPNVSESRSDGSIEFGSSTADSSSKEKTPDRSMELDQEELFHLATYPGTPSGMQIDQSWIDVSPRPLANYATPARYNPQSHPYFVNSVPSPERTIPGGVLNADAENGHEVPAVELHSPETNIKPENAPKARLQTASRPKKSRQKKQLLKRKAAAQSRKPAKRKARSVVEETSDDDETIIYASSDDDSIDEISSSDEDLIHDFVHDASAADDRNVEEPDVLESTAEEVQCEMEDQGPENADEANDEPQENLALNPATVENTTQSTENDEPADVAELDNTSGEVAGERLSKTGKSSKVKGRSRTTTRERSGLPYSIVEMAMMALESKAPAPMQAPEIYEYLEERFEWCKKTDGWKDSVRTSLSRQPQFVKVSKQYKSGWVLSGAPAKKPAVPGKEAGKKTAKPRGRPRSKPAQPPQEKARRPRGRPRKVRGQAKDTPTNAGDQKSVPEIGEHLTNTSAEHHEEPPTTEPTQSAIGHDDSWCDTEMTEGDVELSTLEQHKLYGTVQQAIDEQLLAETSLTLSSDITKDPESETNALELTESAELEARRAPRGSSAASTVAASSSPAVMKQRATSRVYTKASTPATNNSSLLKRLQKRQSSIASTPVKLSLATSSRASSVAAGSGRKRVVYTPAREIGDSEDELA